MRMIDDLITGNRETIYEGIYISHRLSKMGRWYRSKDRKPNFPFGSYMLNKKWTFDEEFNNHMLRFQQVNMSVS